MSWLTDAELYLRGSNTLLASWEAYTYGALNAAVRRFAGVAAAVFPAGPEHAFYATDYHARPPRFQVVAHLARDPSFGIYRADDRLQGFGSTD